MNSLPADGDEVKPPVNLEPLVMKFRVDGWQKAFLNPPEAENKRAVLESGGAIALGKLFFLI